MIFVFLILSFLMALHSDVLSCNPSKVFSPPKNKNKISLCQWLRWNKIKTVFESLSIPDVTFLCFAVNASSFSTLFYFFKVIVTSRFWGLSYASDLCMWSWSLNGILQLLDVWVHSLMLPTINGLRCSLDFLSLDQVT